MFLIRLGRKTDGKPSDASLRCLNLAVVVRVFLHTVTANRGYTPAARNYTGRTRGRMDGSLRHYPPGYKFWCSHLSWIYFRISRRYVSSGKRHFRRDLFQDFPALCVKW
jgi:hypothetical protein